MHIFKFAKAVDRGYIIQYFTYTLWHNWRRDILYNFQISNLYQKNLDARSRYLMTNALATLGPQSNV